MPVFTASGPISTSSTKIVTVVCSDIGNVIAGQCLCLNSTYGFTGGYQRAVSFTSSIDAIVFGLAMNSSVLGQPVDIAVDGDIQTNSGNLGMSIGTGLWLTGVGALSTSPPTTNGYYTSFIGMYVGAGIIRLMITPHGNYPYSNG